MIVLRAPVGAEKPKNKKRAQGHGSGTSRNASTIGTKHRPNLVSIANMYFSVLFFSINDNYEWYQLIEHDIRTLQIIQVCERQS